MENSDYFYKETINSLSDNEVIKLINENIIQASAKGLFIIAGEYIESEISMNSFIEYFKNLGFKISIDYDSYMYKWIYKISRFKHL